MSGKQIQIFQNFKPDELQSYINTINQIKNAENTTNSTLFNKLQAEEYAAALSDVEASQAALLLSTQGLTNAQIAETLAVNESNVAKNYQAMVDAGLLKSKQNLTNAELQNNIAKTLSATMSEKEAVAKSNEMMVSMGLAVAKEGENAQTVKLIASKLGELVTDKKLTQAQAQEIAARSGVLVVTEAQNALAPQWIIKLKAMAIATWDQVKATAAWLATTPAGWIATAVAALGIGIIAYKNHEKTLKKLGETTKEVTDKYKESTSSIDEYASKYQELRDALIKAKGNEEETYNVKKQLLELQKELNEKFGEEYGRLNLVTDAYKDQTEAIKGYNKEAANATLNEIGEKGINNTKNQMLGEKKYNLSSVGLSLYSDEGLAIQELADKYGIDINSDESSGTFNLILRADATTAESTIHDFMSDIRNLRDSGNYDFTENFDNVLNYSNDALKQVEDIIELYGESLRQILIAEIFKDDDDLTKKYTNALEAVKAYNEAVLKSEDPYNDENVQQARHELELAKTAFSTEELENYGYVLNDVFDQADTGLIDFNEKFQKDNELKALAQDLEGMDNVDLESLNSGENESFDKLKESAKEYGLEVDDLINTLIRLGYVHGEVQSSGLNDNPSISLSLPDTIDQLNTRLRPSFDSLKSAYQNIFTDNGDFKLDSIDILSTCDSIKSKLDELNKINGITVDYSSYEDFIRVLRDSESTENEVKDAFNNLADSITNAALSGAEDFETMKAALEDLGVVNNEIVAFDALISNTDALKEAGLDLNNATYEQISAFADEHVAAENLAQAINMLTQQKMLNALEGMDTSTEVANMISLAKKAGMTSEVISNLTELEEIYQEVAKGTLSEYMLSKKLDRAKELKQLIEAGITEVDHTPEVDFSGAEKSSSSAASSVARSFTDLLDKELAVLDKKMEAGYTDFNDYIQARLALIEDYYRQGKLSADEYYSYLEKHYQQELSYRDKVINAVTRRIDKEIDSLEKQKDKIKENYQIQIDALNEEKTLLQDANKERQRQIDMQKAMYELERAKNQRTTLIYSEDRGMHYVADDQAIRDAEQNVEDKEFEFKIAEIEKSIYNLEQARDAETNAIDAMIDKLQEYKDQWNDITSSYEQSQEDLFAAQILGQEWEQDVINARLDTLNKFKDDYIKIQQAMVDAAYQAAQAMEKHEKVEIGDSSKEGSSTPEYNVKKYHTGLKQGPVDKHSFDDDFRLVQKVGLGDKDIPAILKEGEVVATQEQIHNLAAGIRNSQPHVLRPLRPGDEMYDLMQKWNAYMESIDYNVEQLTTNAIYEHNRQMQDSMNQASNASIFNSKNIQPTINQEFNISLPNVTNSTSAEALMRDLQSIAIKKYQVNW